MNSFLPSPRRLLTLGAAAFLGALGALALASPGAAHEPFVAGVARCDTATGDWVVTWTVKNSEDDLVGKLTGVRLTPSGTTVSAIEVGATLPESDAAEVLSGVQQVPASADSASLTVDVHWNRGDGVDASHTGGVKFEGTCQARNAKPGASFASTCQGDVDVTLTNDAAADRPARFVVTGAGGFTEESMVDAGKSAGVTVPKDSASAIKVTEGGATVAEGKWVADTACLPVTGVPTGLIATGGVALAGFGVLMFVLFRRRRIRFTTG